MYLLDLRLLGQGLPVSSRRKIEDILIHTPADNDVDIIDSPMEALYVKFTDFYVQAKCNKDDNTFRFQMLSKKRKSPLQYWHTDGADWPDMQNIDLKIFRLEKSSAASERNFSTFRFILVPPPSGAVHPKHGKTFGELRRLMIEASLSGDDKDKHANEHLSLGCSSDSSVARQL